MQSVFLISAVVGATILICQMLITMLGMGHHDVGSDHGGDLAGHAGAGPSHVPGNADDQHGSTWLLSVVSIRTVVPALTFFGIGGLAAEAAQTTRVWQLTTASVCGLAAMYGAHGTLRLIRRLGEDGTIRIGDALGQEGTVYLTIPGRHASAGKVQIKVRNRLMEYEAVTAGEQELTSGTQIVVVGIEAGPRLKVERKLPSKA